MLNEIQNPRKRYALIDYRKLAELLHSRSIKHLKDANTIWVEETLGIDQHIRDAKWTQSVAVGSKEFVEMTKDKLGYRADGRRVVKSHEDYRLLEKQASYIANSGNKKINLSDDNTYYGTFLM